MSIHAQISEEAQARLNAQKRNSTISSLVIAALVITLIFLVLGYFLLPNIIKESPTIVTYTSSMTEETDVQQKKVTNQIQRKPSAPANSMTKVIASNTASPTAIPVPDIEVLTPNADFGDGEDFGGGWGEAGDMGSGGGFSAIPATMRKRCSKEDRIARLKEMGGRPEAEEVVEKGLEWLKATQNEDGSWEKKSKAAMTGFAVLAYLGRCETPLSEKYGESCLEGITYLVNLGLQTKGKLSTNLTENWWPYEHAIATYAICEATTFCKQLNITVPNLPEVAKMATEFIIDNQHKTSGGWDYSYDRDSGRGGDLSIAAWHVQALKAASHTGLEFKGMSRASRDAVKYVKSMQDKSGGFGYSKPDKPSGKGTYFTMTGGGVLGLQMWGEENSAEVRKGAEYILKNSKFEYDSKYSDLYAHYYEAQAMMIRGGEEWNRYNDMFKDQLVTSQEPDGGWKMPGENAHQIGDKHYRNCLAILMLEVYYRFLPGTAAH